MKHYVKVYFDYFGYTKADEGFIKCEICGQPAVDIHHIKGRGMGGNPTLDVIENLIGLCRNCHELAEAKQITKQELIDIVEAR